MTFEKIEKKYKDSSLADIETKCDKFASVSTANRRDFILALYYLDRTKRFKENPVYFTSTFERYIYDRFHLRYSDYNKERFAFISHPVASDKWGAGIIDKIKIKCGAGVIPDVIKKIEDIKNPTSDKIDKIIEQHTKQPKKEAGSGIPKKEVEAENIRRGKTIAEYLKTINEKDDQIKKLEATVKSLQEENRRLKAENTELKEKMNKARDIFSFWPGQQSFDFENRAAA